MNVASAMSFVWDTKPDFPSVVWILIWLSFVLKLAKNREFHKYQKLE